VVAFLFSIIIIKKKYFIMANGRGKQKVRNFFGKIRKTGQLIKRKIKHIGRPKNRAAADAQEERNNENEGGGLIEKVNFAKVESLPMGGGQVNQNQGEGAAPMDALGVVEKVAGIGDAIGGVIKTLKGGDDAPGGSSDAGGGDGKDPSEKKPFYKTPIGIATIAGGALLVIGGIYFATKKSK
jgi:hypothetical protein